MAKNMCAAMNVTRRVCPAACALIVAVAMAVAAVLAGVGGYGGLVAYGQGGTAPRVTGISIASTPASGTSYQTGEQILFDVTFDQAVATAPPDRGAPTPELLISLGIGIQNRTAVYAGHPTGDANTLRFRYTATANDVDNYGVSVLAKIVDGGLRTPIQLPENANIVGRDNGYHASLDAADLVGDGVDRFLLITNAWQHRVNAINPEPAEITIAEQPGNVPYIELEWIQPGDIDADKYTIHRNYAVELPGGAALPDRAFLRDEYVGGAARIYRDQRNLIDGARYEYTITAYKGRYHAHTLPPVTVEYFNPVGAPNKAVQVVAVGEPPATFTSTDHSVSLDWSARVKTGETYAPLDGAIGYHIYRQAPGETTWHTLVVTDGVDVTTYTDTSLSANRRYAYKIFEDHAHDAHRIIDTVVARTMPSQ